MKLFESRKLTRCTRQAGVLPPLSPSLCEIVVFVGAVFQLFAFPVRLVSAAKTIPETRQTCGVTRRNIVKGIALPEPDGVAAFRIIEAVKCNSFVLRDVADTIMAHTSVGWRGKQHQGDNEMFHGNSLEAIPGSVKA